MINICLIIYLLPKLLVGAGVVSVAQTVAGRLRTSARESKRERLDARWTTRMTNLEALRAALKGSSAKVKDMGATVVVEVGGASLLFERNRAGGIDATVLSGTESNAKRVIDSINTRYGREVQKQTLSRIHATAKSGGWRLESENIAAEHAVELTFARSRP